MSMNKIVFLCLCSIAACRARTYNEDAQLNSMSKDAVPTCADGESFLEIQRIRNTWFDMISDPNNSLNMTAEIPNFRNPLTRTWDCCGLGPVSVCRMHHEMESKGILWINYKSPKASSFSTLLPKATIHLNGMEKNFPLQLSSTGTNFYVTNGRIKCENSFEREELHTKCSDSSTDFKDLFKNAFTDNGNSGEFAPWTLKITFFKQLDEKQEGEEVFTFKLENQNTISDNSQGSEPVSKQNRHQINSEENDNSFDEIPGKR